MHVACGRADMLCASGFTDDVAFSYHGTKGRMASDKTCRSDHRWHTLPQPPVPHFHELDQRLH